MRFGIQTYGFAKEIEKDPKGFFKEMAENHYQLIEPCIWLDGDECPWNGLWGLQKFSQMAKMIQDEGIEIVSLHVFALDVLSHVEQLKEIHRKWGTRLFVFKLTAPFTMENLEKQCNRLCQLADELAAEDCEVLLHNEHDDVAARIDGISAYEWCLQKMGAQVYAEADVGWLMAGGENPEAFLWRNQERIRAVHYKDFDTTCGERREVSIGKGDLDLAACFQFVRAMEIPGIVDMDAPIREDLQNASKTLQMLTSVREHSKSFLNTYDIETGEVELLAEYDGVIEAPNWLNDGDTIIYNRDGLIWRYSISKKTDERIVTGNCTNCNNDHVPSGDNTLLAVSCSPENSWMSQVYVLPITGGEPRCVTEKAPSFLHGFSPDGKELAYCAFREDESGKLGIDICVIPTEGGEERALTHEQGMNDGPEYSMDGNKIWFISTRSGLMQVYQMNRDGSDQRQMTFEEQNNWFGHISPDGSKVVNIAYSKKGLDSNEHLPNMFVSLWLMNSDGTDRRKILDLFGGQGSINVNSWSPDSKRFAFVSYELIHK